MVGVGIECSDSLVGVVAERFGDDGLRINGDLEVSLFGDISIQVNPSVEVETSTVGRSGDGGEG